MSDEDRPAPTVRHKLRSVQIEVTSRCNLNCSTCIKHAYQSVWQEKELDTGLYGQILTHLPQSVKSVHLQGWGEPLLLPQMDEYIRQAKKIGLAVSFTSNGTIMNDELAERIIDSGLDSITFSMAGGNRASHDRLRGRNSFDLMRKSIGIFLAARKRLSASVKCGVSYLLTPQGVEELPGAIRWCRRQGVDLFSTVHLTQTITESQEKLRFNPVKLDASIQRLRRLSWLAGLFSRMNINLRSFTPEPVPVCDKNPLQTLFISSSGLVSPCVFLCPPVGEVKLPWSYNNHAKSKGPVVLGNCKSETVDRIWSSPQYCAFRQQFQKRLNIYEKAMEKVSYSLEGAAQLETALVTIKNEFAKNPPPESCHYCYKMDGF